MFSQSAALQAIYVALNGGSLLLNVSGTRRCTNQGLNHFALEALVAYLTLLSNICMNGMLTAGNLGLKMYITGGKRREKAEGESA